MNLKWARAATKHRISRERSGYVIEHCGLRFEGEPPDDAPGIALEVVAVELDDESLLVIHAMPLRERYREQYEEVKNGEGEENTQKEPED